jgi:16S rRNA (uracil1498-N3)-methyltransferase
MQRYFITEDNFKENIIRGDDVFHIYKVMRNKVNDLIEICYDEKGYIAKLTEISSDLVRYEIVEEITKKTLNKPKITLIQGLAKGDKNDDIIKHSTELGVDNIILISMKRSIVKFSNDKIDNKIARFNKIAKEAAEQSHRFSVPNVCIINSFNELDESLFDTKLLLDEEEAKKIDGLLVNKIDMLNSKSISFVIGPEGGIDNSERDLLIKKGFIPVSLGDNILRTETASLAFLAMLNYKLMEGK